MPRSTALTHFLTARAPEPYRIGPVLPTTQGEGTPSDAGHGLVLVVDRGVIYLITPAASSGTPRASCTRPRPGVGGHGWTMTHSRESAVLLYSGAVRRSSDTPQPMPVPVTPAAPAPGAAFSLSLYALQRRQTW